MVALSTDTGLRVDTFRDLIVYIFLPVLIFDSAFKIDAPLLLRNLSLILISAYIAFLTGEWLLNVSGALAVLVTGLVMGRAVRLVFLLMGMTITVDMFQERWLAMLIGIAGVLIARTVGLLSILPLAGKIPGVQPISVKEQAFMAWSGLRGAVTLALGRCTCRWSWTIGGPSNPLPSASSCSRWRSRPRPFLWCSDCCDCQGHETLKAMRSPQPLPAPDVPIFR